MIRLLTYIAFPGLGIEKFNLERFALSSENLGFIKNIFPDWQGIAWYGIIITLGIVIAAIYAVYRAKQEGISSNTMLDITLTTVIVSVICARLYYVIQEGEYNSFMEIIAIWKGGLGIYGGVIGGAITLVVMGKIKKINPLTLLDIGGASIIIGQAIGRWGNFVNVEAYGYATDLPWRMAIYHANGMVEEVHPTFFYESLWNLVGFFILWFLYTRKKYHGQIAFSYIAWYGFGRMFIEGLRQDSLYANAALGIRTSQWIAGISFVVCTALLIFFGIKYRNNPRILDKKEINNGSDN